jgi:hypothetical protein
MGRHGLGGCFRVGAASRPVNAAMKHYLQRAVLHARARSPFTIACKEDGYWFSYRSHLSIPPQTESPTSWSILEQATKANRGPTQTAGSVAFLPGVPVAPAPQSPTTHTATARPCCKPPARGGPHLRLRRAGASPPSTAAQPPAPGAAERRSLAPHRVWRPAHGESWTPQPGRPVRPLRRKSWDGSEPARQPVGRPPSSVGCSEGKAVLLSNCSKGVVDNLPAGWRISRRGWPDTHAHFASSTPKIPRHRTRAGAR